MASSSNPSLVPNQIPSQLEPVIIDTSGADGYDGSIDPSTNDIAAGYGQNGQDGQNASPASVGASGEDIEIGLSYDPGKPGVVEVISEAHGELEISNRELLVLDTHGGKGGNGGIGGAGQHGGPGYDGANATKFSEAQNGSPGGSGGNGGHGTNGADGGRGGNVLTTVHENELDLLLAVDFNVKGGSGGQAGQHGRPGRGGPGGRGGSSFKYKDESGNSHKRPAGNPGPRGRDGHPPSSVLHPGHDGDDGHTSIKVVMDNEGVKSYVSRYQLVVDSFEVVDENSDGINEPGEYLFVRNIIIRNDGLMPSPLGQVLEVVIRESDWLEPDTTAPLTIPDSILPNRVARILGQLRALIRHESTNRKSGEALNVRDTVSLLAYSPRLLRSVPEFSGGVPIIVQYPLQLPVPVYMDCMEKGDEMTVSWLVNNISTKIYGSNIGQRARTKLIDTGRHFVLQSAAEGSDSIIDEIDQIQSADGSAFGESFTVADDTRTFSTGTFILELHLSDPHSDILRRIMYYEFKIQISEGYGFNSTAQFLLIVNASTNNDAITQIQRFIRTQLHLELDTLNLSLTGTLRDESSQRSTLLNYRSRSIIVTGNSFIYFSKHKRFNWELMDPRDVRTLLMSQTSFLFCGVSSSGAQALEKWKKLLRYPADIRVETTDSLVQYKDRRTLLKAIRNRSSMSRPTLDVKDQYILNNGFMFCREMERRLQSNGTNLSKKLDKQAPTRRFLVTPEDPSTGTISVMEGLSKTSNCMVSTLSIVDSQLMITPHQEVMIIASIPFHILTVLFWNMIGSVSSSGITAEVMYRNLPGFYTYRDLSDKYDYGREGHEYIGGRMISYEVCQAISWSVERALDSDIQQLCKSSPILDTISNNTVLSHTPRLHQFLQAIPDDSATPSNEGIELAIQVLGSLNTALKSSNIIIDLLSHTPGLCTRRVKIRRHVSRYRRHALSFMVPPSMTKEIKAHISKETSRLKREQMRDSGKDKRESRLTQNVIRRKLAALTGDAPGFVDIAAESEGSVYLDLTEFQNHRAEYGELLEQQRADEIYARETRRETITRVSDTIDFLPLTSLN